jgi:hypothetical protein
MNCWKNPTGNHSFYVDNPWSDVKVFKSTSCVMVLFGADVDLQI